MGKNYYIERNKKNRKKLSEIISYLPDFCEDFFVSIDSRSSDLTMLNYAFDLKIFFKFLADRVIKKNICDITCEDMETIKAKHIEQFLSYLSFYESDGKEYRNSDKGKARKLSAVRSLFKYMFNNDLISKNISTKVLTPKIHQKEIIRLEVDEVAHLLNETESPHLLTDREKLYNKITRKRDLALLSVFLGTGIRISECVGLNVEDVDLNNNSFTVTRKGGSQSVLYFSDEVSASLTEWIAERNTISPEDKTENALFLSLQKKRISIRAVENLVKKYAQAVSPLKKISPHKLRSTFGTNLYREIGDIYAVADVLGHKDVNTTKKHYAAINEDSRRSLALKVKLR